MVVVVRGWCVCVGGVGGNVSGFVLIFGTRCYRNGKGQAAPPPPPPPAPLPAASLPKLYKEGRAQVDAMRATPWQGCKRRGRTGVIVVSYHFNFFPDGSVSVFSLYPLLYSPQVAVALHTDLL